ncbi:hypothetical protein SAMN04488516_11713 [Desulfonauticus submarinus]|uniref:Uncharacterized protein n=1 Tax=Desulfonauticus submarinus TaxID=206665 RepID=A0A1H0G9C6_9BACT|nr:hypothetical protein [Desulfonauticus submarinus]SDO03466.1 hypothetical protein SAMN04488516_11713 [Desulfonauticus submarinus]
MLYEKIMSVHNALGVLSHRVDKETWAVIKIARSELMDAADMAQELTEHLTCPRKPCDKSNDKTRDVRCSALGFGKFVRTNSVSAKQEHDNEK